jgi:hypothetical protein
VGAAHGFSDGLAGLAEADDEQIGMQRFRVGFRAQPASSLR